MGGGGDIINMNSDIHIIVNMNIQDYVKCYALFITLLMPFRCPIDISIHVLSTLSRKTSELQYRTVGSTRY